MGPSKRQTQDLEIIGQRDNSDNSDNSEDDRMLAIKGSFEHDHQSCNSLNNVQPG